MVINVQTYMYMHALYGVCDCNICVYANVSIVNLHYSQDFDRRVVPEAGLDEVIVEDKIMKQLREIVQYEKARSVLFGQWGFARRNHQVHVHVVRRMVFRDTVHVHTSMHAYM